MTPDKRLIELLAQSDGYKLNGILHDHRPGSGPARLKRHRLHRHRQGHQSHWAQPTVAVRGSTERPQSLNRPTAHCRRPNCQPALFRPLHHFSSLAPSSFPSHFPPSPTPFSPPPLLARPFKHPNIAIHPTASRSLGDCLFSLHKSMAGGVR